MSTTKTSEPMGVANKYLKLYGDGTIGTTTSVRRHDWRTRPVLANRFVGMHVEIVVRERYLPERVVIGTLVGAGKLNSGTTRDVLLVQVPGELLPQGYSLATVESITQLSDDEWAKAVHS